MCSSDLTINGRNNNSSKKRGRSSTLPGSFTFGYHGSSRLQFTVAMGAVPRPVLTAIKVVLPCPFNEVADQPFKVTVFVVDEPSRHEPTMALCRQRPLWR